MADKKECAEKVDASGGDVFGKDEVTLSDIDRLNAEFDRKFNDLMSFVRGEAKKIDGK